VTLALDASALIAHFDAGDAHHERVRALLLRALGQQLVASPITIAEVLVGPARTGHLDNAVNALRILGVRTVDLDQDGPSRLAGLRAETGLKLPDCCVILAAQSAAAAVVTFDDRLATVGRDLNLDVLGR
jgi:predicted nucleic acid-binding protein